MRKVLSSISKISQTLVIGLILMAAGFTPLTQAGAQDFTARFMADYGNVTVMEVTGNFDAENPDGSVNAVPRQRIANEFFRTHKDEYDFVTIFTNFDYQLPKDAVAFYSSVKNDIRGIGQEIYDSSSSYGSNGKLQGTIDMGNLFKLATNPLDPKFDFTSDIMVHETLHRWGRLFILKIGTGLKARQCWAIKILTGVFCLIREVRHTWVTSGVTTATVPSLPPPSGSITARWICT